MNEVNKYLATLEGKQKIASKQLGRGTFYRIFKEDD
jgi:hypothetical protein